MNLDQIQIRDPFLVIADGGYLLTGSTDIDIWKGRGTGFNGYRSYDLDRWTGPTAVFRPPSGFWSPGQYWAPEIHPYRGRWYLFATFGGVGLHPETGLPIRGTQVLVADAVDGPFEPWSDGPLTPSEWPCLDGTLFLAADGTPWMVFCREWLQVRDGEMYAQRLTDDLRGVVGPPVYLFSASAAPWVRSMPGADPSLLPALITDGPFLFRLRSGHLLMLWSSFGDDGYAMGLAHSESGEPTGPWTHEHEAIWSSDGGHGMVARIADGRLVIALHQPNDTPNERTVLRFLEETAGTVRLMDSGPVAGAYGVERRAY